MTLNRWIWHASIAAAFGLQGCTSILTPIGQNKYECNRSENPDSPYCHSFKAAEGSTHGAIPDSRYDQAVRMTDMDRLAGIAPLAQATNVPEPAAPTSKASGAAPAYSARGSLSAPLVEGQPVREAGVVQRVWIKRYVDGNDMLVGNTYVYKEIEPARWAGFLASESVARPARVYPHRAEKAVGDATSAPSATGAAAPTKPAAAARPGRPDTNRPEFSQPGVTAPSQADDLAPVPATSGTSSMPQ